MNVLSLTYLGLVGASSILLWLTPRKIRFIVTAIANIAFLYLLQPNEMVIALLVILLIYTWLCGLLLKHYPKKVLAWILSIITVLPLAWFKYAGYFIGGKWYMPLGLSFFTFRAIRYMVDIERNEMEPTDPISLFDYLYFFPAFQAGPIHKCKSFIDELKEPFIFDYVDQKNGCIQAGLGLFQKFVIADYLSQVMAKVFVPELDGWYTVFGMFLYAIQLYVDFDAYSNIAIGSARMMGFHLDRNFHTPYLAVSLRDFWRRWHISLSTWLRDYIYIPLGGSRHGLPLKWVNNIVLMLVSGVWHGSTMPFIYWGLGHGVISVLEDMIRQAIKKIHFPKWLGIIATPFGIIINFIIVTGLWVFFRASSLQEALQTFEMMKPALSTMPSIDYEVIGLTLNEWHWLLVLLAMVFVSDIMRYFTDMIAWLSRRFILIRWVFYFVLMIVAIIFGIYGPGYDPQNFIYVTF